MASFVFKGVPFFLLLSGFLLSTKPFDGKYYKRGLNVILSYIFFSVVVILFRKYYLHEELSWLKWILKIFDYSAIPYAWYIEMWIGLFLLSPFLNILYRNIETKKRKQLLLGILVFLTAVPYLTNRYGQHIMPEYWKQIYPFTFYFIGAYIKEYKPTCPFKIGIPLVLAISMINPVFNMIAVKNSRPLLQIAGDPYALFGMVNAVVIFLMFYRIDIKSDMLKKCLSVLAKSTLGIYLCCYIFDAIYYPIFKEHFFVNQQQFGIYFFVIVPLIYISSFALAQVKNLLFKVTGLQKVA